MNGTNGERYQRAVEVFLRVCDAPETDREAILREACGGDAELLEGARSLLEDDARASDPLDRAATAVSDLLGEEDGAEFPIPERIGAFRVLGRIGEGGMGIVYEAEQESPRRSVALKVVRPGMATPRNLRRFELESDVLGRLEHPGIARIYEAGMAETPWGLVPYFAMERVRGRSITEHCAERGLARRERVELLARVCEAVEHAHGKGVVHRDLKPSNVLVAEDGAPKVLDFGVARLTERGTDARTELTLEGQVVGTLATMSPEQVRGDSRAIDARTDVYALGAIGYELLAGKAPLDVAGRSLAEAARIVEETEPAPLSKWDRGCRGDLDVILATALEKDPARRYASASALAADLQRYLRDEPILARSPSAATLLRKFTRRNRALVAGAIAGVAALAIGGSAAVWKAVEAVRSEHAARRQSYRANLAAASAALRNNDVAEAAVRLDEAPPEIRGWEWRHLRSRLDASIAVFKIGDAPVIAMDVSPDGRLVAASTENKRLQLWSMLDGERVAELAAPIPDVVALRFAPDGSRLNAASEAYSRLRGIAFEIPSLREIGAWESHVLRSYASAYSLDGSRLVRLMNDRKLVTFDATTGAVLATSAHMGAPATVSFSRDGLRLAIADTEGFEVRRSSDGEVVFRRGETGGASAASFSPDGARLVVGMHATEARVVDATTGADLFLLTGHGASVPDARFSPDGASIATACSDGSLRLWDAALGAPKRTWRGHVGRIRQLAFTPDGERIATAGQDGAVRIWSAGDTGEPYLLEHGQTVYPAAFSPDGRRLATGCLEGGRPTLRIWDVETGAPIAAWMGQHVMSLAWSPDGARIAIGGHNKSTEQIDAATGESVRKTPGHTYNTDSLAYDPTGRRLLSSGLNGFVSLRDADTGQSLGSRKLGPRQWDSSPIYRAVFGPDGSWAAASRSDGSIDILDGATLELRSSWRAHAEPVNALAVSRDGRWLASGSKAGEIAIWRVAGWSLAARLRNHVGEVFALAFSPDGSRLVSGGRDRTIRVWDTESWDVLTQLVGHTSFVYSLVFSPDGDTLVSTSGDDTARLWGVRSRAERHRLGLQRAKRVAAVEPEVEAAFAAAADATAAVERLRAHDWPDAATKETALQAVLGRATTSRPAPR